MKKKNIVILTGKDKIDNFFKEIGHEELSKGIDINSSKRFEYQDKVAKKSKRKDLNTISKAPAKLSRIYTPKEDDRIIAGYGSTDAKDWVDDVVTIEALKKAKKHLLRTGTNTTFWNHDTDTPIGRVIATGIDKTGLWVEVLISKAKDIDDMWTKIKEKIISSFSIRFIAKKIEIEKDDNGTIIAWKIKELELLEVSVVGLPMNKEASIVDVRGKSIKSLFNKGVKKMNKAKKAKLKETIKGLLADLLGDSVKEAVGTAVDEKMAELAEAKTAEEAKEAKKQKKAEKKADKLKKAKAKAKAKADKKDEDSEEMKTLKKKNAKLEKKLAKKLKTSKKGVDSDDDDDDSDDDVPKKVLKSVEDEDTCVFVLKCMDDTELFNTLSDVEKKKATALYFAMGKSEGKF